MIPNLTTSKKLEQTNKQTNTNIIMKLLDLVVWIYLI